MSRKRIRVELSTPRGKVFSGVVSAVEMRTREGLISITSSENNYLSMIHTTEISLRTGSEFLVFLLENASANLAKGRLTVLAEQIRPLEVPCSTASEDPQI